MKITLLTVSLLPAIAALRAPRHYYEERFYDVSLLIKLRRPLNLNRKLSPSSHTHHAFLLSPFHHQWMNKHGHDFSDGNEFVKRLQIWAEADGKSFFLLVLFFVPCGLLRMYLLTTHVGNTDYIEEHNQGNHTFVLGHNQYSHLSPEEFTYMMGFKGEEYKKRGRVGQPQGLGAMDLESLADAIDWVELGAVTNVKDQGKKKKEKPAVDYNKILPFLT